ncbi:MAG: ribosome small subunit-dependent GTPase A [Clostridia bacterium]|nr:ribosome small subunit-dependent GTPase A [Clostridia bacterium]
MHSSTMTGLVTQTGGGTHRVATGEATLACTVRGRLAQDPQAVCLGDRVMVTQLDDARGIIESVLPRSSQLSRMAAGKQPREQIIAANIDQVVLVFAAADPAFKETAINRYLVVAEHCGIPALVCVNKADIADWAWLQGRTEVYRGIGYHVVLASALTGDGIPELREALAGRVSALVGPSGVGKSSLINAVEPGLDLATGEVGSGTHKGRHTTTGGRLLALSSGGYVADTPGMREFGFWKIPRADLALCYREIRPLIGQCKYKDCSHVSEPGCAVRAAVDDGRISRERYDHYARLTREG